MLSKFVPKTIDFACLFLRVSAFLAFIPLVPIAFSPIVLAQVSGAARFLPAVTYSSGGLYPTSVAVADVNRDGKTDLVVVNVCRVDPNCGSGSSGDGTVAVILGNGDGTFRPSVIYDSGGVYPNSLKVADVRGNGKLDIIIANSGSNNIAVLLGNGDGTFQPATTYDSGGEFAMTVALADLNGDGKLDAVVANCNKTGGCSYEGVVGVLLGNGDGTFQSVVTYDSGGAIAYSAAVGDLNGDGKPDIVVANWCATAECANPNGIVGVLLGNGDGTFQAPVSYPTECCGDVVVDADVNGDSRLDVIVGIWAFNVGVMLGNGDGTLQPAMLYGTGGSSPWSVAVADVNGDGKPDLVAANCGPLGSGANCEGPQADNGEIGVLLGNGDGTYQPPMTFDSGGKGAQSVAVADVNGDGAPDLVVANINSSTVGVLLNNVCTAVPSVTLSATPRSLWPPDGRMVAVTVSGKITDAETGCKINTAAFSAKDEYGKVQPSGPVTVGAGGAYNFTIWLQASRLGTDPNGRLYTITVSASNNRGKIGSQVDAVIVPHDHGQ